MKEQLVSFETAKLAKKKGFDWGCQDCFSDGGRLYSDGWCENLNNYFKDEDFFNSKIEETELIHKYYATPTQSLLQEWIEATFNIVIYLKPSYDHLSCELKGFYFTLNDKNGGEVDRVYLSLDDKYKGLEIMLKGALKLITK